MDKNDTFEQEFIQNTKISPQPVDQQPIDDFAQTKVPSPSSLPLIIAAVLSMVVIIESIVIAALVLNNNARNADEDEGSNYVEVSPPDTFPYEERGYIYNSTYDIISLDLTCIADDNSEYSFTKTNTYNKRDNAGNTIDSGSYTIIKNSIVSLDSSTNPSSTKNLFADGENVIEDSIFYDCEENQ